jgi:CubicO group peptidase (beta-lactamase class C family)
MKAPLPARALLFPVLALLARGGELAPSDGGLARVVQPYVDNQTISGSVIVIASRERVLDVETVGFADLATKRPMTADTLFGIASMGKPMAATAVMMLVDEGKLKVDDAAEKYLPEFKGQMVVDPQEPARPPHAPQHPVTIRELLTHTSGLPYSTPEEKPTLDGHPLAEAAGFYGHTPLQFEPGTRYLYSSAGINTAARIVEVTSGMPYEDFLQQRLFGPLGMKDTTFWPSEAQLQRQALFYKANAAESGLAPAQPVRFTFPLSDRGHRYPIPGSGLFSTGLDLARYCQMMLNGGTWQGRRYLSPESFAQMTTRQTPASVPNAYGFGWQIDKDGGFSHGGHSRPS